jgi:hypothetical protein
MGIEQRRLDFSVYRTCHKIWSTPKSLFLVHPEPNFFGEIDPDLLLAAKMPGGEQSDEMAK